MTQLIFNKRHLVSIVLAWFILIGIDFLFHASLLAGYWNADLPALKPLDDLALLIPAGYLSFLLLTALVGIVFFKIFKTMPAIGQVFGFGLVFALLFSLSNLLGLYSYVDLPLKHLVVFNLVYFIEIIAITLCFYYFSFKLSLRKSILYTVVIFFGLIIIGIIIQNIFPTS